MSSAHEVGIGRVELRTLVEQTQMPVAACDATGTLTLLSPPLEELFNQRFTPVPSAEYPARFRLLAHDGVTPLRPQDVPLTRALHGEVVRDAIVCTSRTDGSVRYLRCNAAPLRSADGTVLGAIVLVQDVTADQAAAQEHAELRDRLVETINHEFRTPLTKVVGHAELLRDTDAPFPAHARRSIEVIHQAAQELRSLLETVTQLIDLDPRTKLNRRSTNLASLLRDIAADFATTLQSRTAVRTDAPDVISTSADPVELRRAIWELLTNAATYGPPGGPIVLRATYDEETVHISVEDRGDGIAPEHRDRLVHPFERGDHAQQPVNSKGLGLAIARNVAAAHGGCLELSDNQPHGLCATLILPAP